MRHTAIATGIVLLLASSAEAGGGVIEINQTAAIAGGITPSDTPGFPVTIDSPGSYALTGNLAVSAPNTSGIVISGSRVTLDLAGFLIAGPGSCSGSGTFLTCSTAADSASAVVVSGITSGVRVQSGALRGFGAYGIDLANGTADRLHVSENVSGGIFTTFNASMVTDSVAERNKGDGIKNLQGVVRNCKTTGNSGIGINAQAALIEGNVVRSNGLQGIWDDQRSIIRGNLVTGNNADGIVVHKGALVIDNETSFNGQAGVSALAVSSIQRNMSHGNSGVGLYLVPESDPTGPSSPYRENVVTGNGATVSGGVNLGNNACSGTTSTTTACP